MLAWGAAVKVFPVVNDVDHWRDLVFLNPIQIPIPNQQALSRAGRMAWSLLRHPVKSREFPAEQERLVTSDELMRYGLAV